MVVYTCPKCGSDLQEEVLASNPPQYRKFCIQCGWSHTESEREEIYRIPYTFADAASTIPEACRGCSNHPSNGGTGVCQCTLGTTVTFT